MSISQLKNKIKKSIDEMDADQLQSAYLILKEIVSQQKYVNKKIDRNLVDQKIAKGIRQLDNGEGTDFRSFLNEVQGSYGKKK
jgi:hypothetical protein